MAELSFPPAGISVSPNIFFTLTFTKLGCSPVILAQICLAREAWLLKSCCLSHEVFTLLVCRQRKYHLLYECTRQAAAYSFIINYLPEKENFPI